MVPSTYVTHHSEGVLGKRPYSLYLVQTLDLSVIDDWFPLTYENASDYFGYFAVSKGTKNYRSNVIIPHGSEFNKLLKSIEGPGTRVFYLQPYVVQQITDTPVDEHKSDSDSEQESFKEKYEILKKQYDKILQRLESQKDKNKDLLQENKELKTDLKNVEETRDQALEYNSHLDKKVYELEKKILDTDKLHSKIGVMSLEMEKLKNENEKLKTTVGSYEKILKKINSLTERVGADDLVMMSEPQLLAKMKEGEKIRPIMNNQIGNLFTRSDDGSRLFFNPPGENNRCWMFALSLFINEKEDISPLMRIYKDGMPIYILRNLLESVGCFERNDRANALTYFEYEIFKTTPKTSHIIIYKAPKVLPERKLKVSDIMPKETKYYTDKTYNFKEMKYIISQQS